jgi:hypothetical protein
MKDILDLTHIQFKNIIIGIARKIKWEIRLSVASLNSDFKDDEMPLYTKPTDDRVFRLNDALKLKNMADS